MLKSIEKYFSYILNAVLPPRSDFDIVKKLTERDFQLLPKATAVVDYDWIHPLYQYRNDKVRAIIWELKYKENALPLLYIGKYMYDEILDLISDIILFNKDAEFLLIPIPISEERRHKRGYNQSEYIAKSVLENDTNHSLIYAPQWFQKIRETNNQSEIESKKDRMANILGCFEADPRLEGKYVILIDDVVTTGSTLAEAKRTLLEAGARDVFAFTIAH